MLRGADRAAVAAAARGADAVVLMVGPRLSRSFDAAQRVAEYADTLVASARTTAAVHPRVVFTSSTSVYGAGSGTVIDERSPTTGDADASPRSFIAAAALDFVVSEGLTGVYNAFPDAAVPPTNAEAFGEICAAEGLAELAFRGETRTPEVPVPRFTSAPSDGAG
ncbi:hypothetical protein HUT06_17150 [Actinomadura sp. NAK00032]|uniref:hypothetical protein n=1 Tax=Actinomadura sp. NAK00032 TaxID=2742128 RepID=UPI0015925637|nr:hypothetical protein [Actinomadura sp. NAK00032]QKW35549.1 hypothetical protein HUT06_17150 [Actinomadura sp. NAK00032]